MNRTKTLLFSIALTLIAFAGWNTFNATSASDNFKQPIASNFGNGLNFQIVVGKASNLSTTNNYSHTLTAETVEGNNPDRVSIHGKVNESDVDTLSGLFNVSFHYNRANNGIVSGHWTRIVRHTNADGTTTVLGTLRGDVTGGSVTLRENGGVSSAADVRLSITGGTGNFAQVNAGSGTFAGTIREPGDQQPALPAPPASESSSNPQAAPPAFSGTMSLSF